MRPKIFIASSLEGMDVARALEIGLQYDGACTAWYEAFPLSHNTIDTLLRRCAENDFAIFVFSPEDRAEIRKEKYDIARDNVLFESGLFMGMRGKARAFIVMPRGNPSFHLPTDLFGFTPATYDYDRAKKEAPAALGAAVAEIVLAIKNSLWSEKRLEIKRQANLARPPIVYLLKVYLTFTNNQNTTAAVESKGFAFAADLRPDPKTGLRPGDNYRFEFLIGRDLKDPKQDLYVRRCVLEPRQSVNSWIPIDPDIGEEALRDKLNSQQAGVLHYRVYWLGDAPTVQEFEDKL